MLFIFPLKNNFILQSPFCKIKKRSYWKVWNIYSISSNLTIFTKILCRPDKFFFLLTEIRMTTFFTYLYRDRAYRELSSETNRVVALRALSPKITASYHLFRGTLPSKAARYQDLLRGGLPSYYRRMVDTARCASARTGLSGWTWGTIRRSANTKFNVR